MDRGSVMNYVPRTTLNAQMNLSTHLSNLIDQCNRFIKRVKHVFINISVHYAKYSSQYLNVADHK